jgi:hypothetical protein
MKLCNNLFSHHVNTHNLNPISCKPTLNTNGFIMKNQDLIPADLGNETG